MELPPKLMKKHWYYIICISLLLFTRVLFVGYEQAFFNSDSAIFGIMAMDIADFERFPVFTYGEKYAMALSAYLAAPLFALFSPSVLLLKLPILAINIFVLVLMTWILVRETGIDYFKALVSTSFFTACSFVIGARFTNPENGIEAFMFIFMGWILRRNPLLFGIVAGLGFHIRGFTVYGTAWTLFFLLVERKITLRYMALFATTFTLVFFGIFLAGSYAPNYCGSETGVFLALTSPGRLPAAISFLWTRIIPAMFGAGIVNTTEIGIPGNILVNTGGMHIAAAAGLVLVAAIAMSLMFRNLLKRDIQPADHFPLFMVATGLTSCAVYTVMFGDSNHVTHIRYVFFALLIPTGLATYAIKGNLSIVVNRVLVAAVAVVAVVNVWGNCALWREYIYNEPANTFRDLSDYLVENEIKYAAAEYWTAYHVTFLSGEKVIVNPNSNVRIYEYSRKYMENAMGAYRIRSLECAGGEKVHDWYVCPREADPPGHE